MTAFLADDFARSPANVQANGKSRQLFYPFSVPAV